MIKLYHGSNVRVEVISIEKLIEELKYAKGITFQYFFGTDNALKMLRYDTAE